MNFFGRLAVMAIGIGLNYFAPVFAAGTNSPRPGGLPPDINPGSLQVLKMAGKEPSQKLELPLKHTEVKIEVSGFVAQALVTQRYHNPYQSAIEAVYTFPLPHDAAVDDMKMVIGDRVIQGMIKRREEARRIYESAREKGQRAALLEQERPNIFTQSVANILPGDEIVITLRYVHILQYSEGAYELVFPTVVGPRYIPGQPATRQSGSGISPDTDKVSDASRITPPVLKPGERSGHDIALSVELDAGVAIQGVHSSSHAIDMKEMSASQRRITLHPSDTIPNKDFILRYEVAGQTPDMALLAHHDQRGGFFTLLVQPQHTVGDEQTVPRELIFIVDTSGSMSGFPIEKSKEVMRKLVGGMRSGDTFNVVRFSGDTGTLWEHSRFYTPEHAQQALQYIETFNGGGGTEMQKGIMEALSQPAEEGVLRIAFLLTDGYVGNEVEILRTIEKEKRGARVFTLGIGSSVNRYLIDRAAAVGLGEAFYVRQDEESREVIEKFFRRVDRPTLAHLQIDWNGLDVHELYPARIPDLWAGQPIRLHGRYQQGGNTTITVSGQFGAKPYTKKLQIHLPQLAPAHEALASVWARQRVEELMDRLTREGEKSEITEAVITTGLEFRLMTQWTSFVAVEEKVVNIAGKPEKVVQPVELPEGVSYEGIFGNSGKSEQAIGGNPGGLGGGFRTSPPASIARGFIAPAPRQKSYDTVTQTLADKTEMVPMEPSVNEEKQKDQADGRAENEAVIGGSHTQSEREQAAKKRSKENFLPPPAIKAIQSCCFKALSVSDGLKFAQISPLLNQKREEIERLITQYYEGTSVASGQIEVTFTLTREGRVESLVLKKIDLDDQKLFKILEKTISLWQFPTLIGEKQALVKFILIIDKACH